MDRVSLASTLSKRPRLNKTSNAKKTRAGHPLGVRSGYIDVVIPSNVTTHVSLLARLSDEADRTAWHDFCSRYGEMIRHFARQQQLQPADIDDVLQDVLVALTRSMPGFRYDPAKGKFRSYLKTVVVRVVYREKKSSEKATAAARRY